MTTRHFLLLSFLLLLLFAACADAERPEEVNGRSAADTTELGTIYDAIDAQYQQMMARYRQMAPQMPAGVRDMYEYMEQMHGQALQQHHQMMGQGMMGRGMMGRGMRGAGMMDMYQTQEWDQQMLAMHEQMSRYLRQQGYDEMAGLHDQMTQLYHRAIEALPGAEGEAAEAPETPEGTASGAALFQQYCATCHGPNAQGLAGAFPPLAGSEWVTSEKQTPTRIALHGLQGSIEVEGHTYNGTMPAFGARLSNEEVAAVLSYVRNTWGNQAPEITTSDVRTVRRENAGRTQPWTPSSVR